MPRNHLPKARKVVKAFCAEKGIPYYETGVLDSYREIIEHLHEIAAFLRRNDARRGKA